MAITHERIAELMIIAFNDTEAEVISDIVAHDASRSCYFNYYEIEKKRFVRPGKRGPKKATGYQYPFSNFINDLKRRGCEMTEAELRESYKRSDDILGDWEILAHRQVREMWLAIKDLI